MIATCRTRFRPFLSLLVVSCLTAAAWGQGGAAGAQSQVYIEDSPVAQDLADEAMALRNEGRINDAADRVQRVLDDHAQKLMRTGDGLYADAAAWAARTLAADAELAAAYRNLYGAAAERALREAVAPTPDPAALERVRQRYTLTPAGLDAGLALAALALERAEPAAAAAALDAAEHHPDLDSRRARYEMLRGAAALLRGDREAFDAHRAAVEKTGDGASLASLDALVSSFTGRVGDGGEGEPDAARAADVPPLAEPLWERSLAALDESVPPGLPGQNGAGSSNLLSTVPAAAGMLLFINDGAALHALDRVSGRTLWSVHREAPVINDERQAVRMFYGYAQPPDRRSALVVGERVVAVLGRQGRLLRPGADIASTSGLYAADRETGEVLWRLEPVDVDPSLDKAAFTGSLLHDRGRLLVMMERTQVSGLRDVYALAVDASTGHPLWRRHLASTVSARRNQPLPPARMTLDAGRLIVCDNLAVAASIDPATGSVRWLYLSPDAEGAVDAGLSRRGDPADVAPPVAVPAGVVVPLGGKRHAALLLDADTGRRLRELADQPWDAAPRLMPVDGDLLAIGRRVTRLDGKTLDTKWSRDLPIGPSTLPHGEPAIHHDPAGDALLLPLQDVTITLSLSDGKVLRRTPSNGANLLALEGQVVAVTSDRVRSYLAWDAALALLERQMTGDPLDPRPGLAMAHLGLQTGRADAVIRGAQGAVEALNQRSLREDPASDPQRPELFRQLLRFTDADRGADRDLREQMLQRIAAATATASEEVGLQLATGRLQLERGEFASAVDHFQAVLADPTLAAAVDDHGGVRREAGVEAARLLQEAVTRGGPTVYARYDAMAAAELARFEAMGGGGPEELLEVARRYPLANAAAEALYRAADALQARGETAAALRRLREAYELSRDRTLLGPVAARRAELFDAAGRPDRAARWLRQVNRRYPGLALIGSTGTRLDLTSWLAKLDARAGETAGLPALAPPLGQPYLLPGRPLISDQANADHVSADRLVTWDGRSLRMFGLGDRTPAWTVNVPASDLELAALDDERVVLFSPSARTLWSLNADDGQITWTTGESHTVDADAADPEAAKRDAAQRRVMEMLDIPVNPRPQRPGVVEQAGSAWVRMGESAIVVGDASGRLVGVEAASGRSTWSRRLPVVRVLDARAQDDALAISATLGEGDAVGGSAAGLVSVIDMTRGAEAFTPLALPDAATWIRPAGDRLLLAGRDWVSARRLTDGSAAWDEIIKRPGGADLTNTGWADADAAVLLDAEGHALVLDATTGKERGRPFVGRFEMGVPAAGLLAGEMTHVLAGDRAVAINAETGKLAWRDALRGQEQNLRWQWAGDSHLLLLADHDEAGGQTGAAGDAAGAGVGGAVVRMQQGGAVVRQLDDREVPDNLPPEARRIMERVRAEQRDALQRVAQVQQQDGGDVVVQQRIRIVVQNGDGPPVVIEQQGDGRNVVQVGPDGRVQINGGAVAAGGAAVQSVRRPMLWLLERDTGRLVAQAAVDAPAPLEPAHSRLLEGAAAIATGGQTLVIPASDAR